MLAKLYTVSLSRIDLIKSITPALRIGCFLILLLTIPCKAAAEDFEDAIRAYLKYRSETDAGNGAIVVGLVDEHGPRTISFGKLGGGSDKDVDGDTVFEIHSQTCIYTGLLLQDMVQRGEMKLDDPVAKYLPKSVRVPSRKGKEITLRHLVTETAGLPDVGDKLEAERADNPYKGYTVDKMYAYLSGFELTRDPGAQFVHGGMDVALLGHAIELKAGTDYETLVVDRICNPLGMDSTRFTLTPELKSRLATRYNPQGYEAVHLDRGVAKPLAGLHSTANDLLKFVSANLGFTKSSLTPLLEKHVGNFVWGKSQEPGIVHIGGGGTAGGSVYSGFDKTRRRGVVVLTASGSGRSNARSIGKFLLECPWQSDQRPIKTKVAGEVYGSYAGEYRRSPDWALGVFAARQFLRTSNKAILFLPAAVFIAGLACVLWRVGEARRRWFALGAATLALIVLAPLVVLISGYILCARYEPRIGIRAEGDRLFVEATSAGLWPIDDWYYAQTTGLGKQAMDMLWPPIPTELLAKSETAFFERLSATPLTFSRNAGGKVTALVVDYRGRSYRYGRVSDIPPKPPELPKPRLAIKVDAKLLDACVGQYEFPPDAISPSGLKLRIRREGDHLVGEAKGENVARGKFEIYPESETSFFLKIDGAQLVFAKNERGQVTAVSYHLDGHPTVVGKKVDAD
jgi:serine-type D-Ala-D-Ala carboxypeptidase/endopeptidase